MREYLRQLTFLAGSILLVVGISGVQGIVSHLQIPIERQYSENHILEHTLAQYSSAPLTPSGRVNITELQRQIELTNTNTYNFMIRGTDGNSYLDFVESLEKMKGFAIRGKLVRFWATLMPPTELRSNECSIPVDSPLTPFNETSYFNMSLGIKGCFDFYAWSLVIGKLAVLYPQLVALNIDDFAIYNIDAKGHSGIFTYELIDKIRVNLKASGAEKFMFVPTLYYSTREFFHQQFVLDHLPELSKHVDGFLFYFRNEKNGIGPCIDCPSDILHPFKCWFGCLAGTCAEKTVSNVANELSDVMKYLNSTQQLHFGFYATGHSLCGTPSHKYVYDIMDTVLKMMKAGTVDGITVYTMKVPQSDCKDIMGDEGCIVQSLFDQYWV